jgi:cell wall-associated NlpC family hydrolase
MTDLSQLAPGDLLFFDTSGRGRVNHCGIYLGGGKFIHASSGRVYSVTISDLTRGFYRRTFCWGGKVPLWQHR